MTNVYFETALTDLECGRQQMDFQDRLQEEVQLAYESGELDAACFDKEGRLVPGQKTDDFIKKIQAQKIEYLRMSKKRSADQEFSRSRGRRRQRLSRILLLFVCAVCL